MLLFFVKIGLAQQLLSCRPGASIKDLQENFEQPDMIYAPFAFWFWDNKPNNSTITAMAKQMVGKGLNPGYVHARYGLPAEEWLSPTYLESFKSALEQARSHKAYLGYCDEYWWPSGRANGKVLQQNPELKAVSLNWRIIYAKKGEKIKIPSSFFVVAAQLEKSDSVMDDRILSKTLTVIGEGKPFIWNVPEGEWKIYIFNKYFHEGYDGGDVNYLDTRLAPAFIKLAYEPYQQFEKDFGKSLPGVFIDHEGDYGWKLAWSDDLESRYIQKKEKNIRLLMPLLIDEDNEGNWVSARYDWFDVVSDLYSNDFLGKLSNTLEEKGLYAISNLWEENLYFQALNLGDAFKAHRAVSFPGNDCLFQKAMKVHDFKEIQSISEFKGTRFQTEILGVEGWEMTPVTMKKTVNSVICWGASHIVPHGINLNRVLSTIPFPADWFTSNPYWRYMNLWTDFTRRASFINSHGYTDADVLVLNPMSSVWSLIGGEIYCDTCEFYESPEDLPNTKNYNRLRQIDNVYTEIIEKLTQNRVEFLITDEYYLNKMEILPNPGLKYKSHTFYQLILPDLFCLQRETAQKILDFAVRGGKVYFLGELPSASVNEGIHDKEFAQIIAQLKNYAIKIEKIDNNFKSHIELVDGNFPLIQSHRIIDGRHFFWLVNNSDSGHQITLKIKALAGEVSKWNCETGTINPLKVSQFRDDLLVKVIFDPFEAFWLTIDPESNQKKDIPALNPILIKEIPLTESWEISIDSLDQPVFFDGQTSFPIYSKIATGNKIPDNWESWGLDYFSGFIDYKIETKIELPEKYSRVTLDLGAVYHMAEIQINNKPCGEKLWPPFKFDITSLVKKGENNLVQIKVGNLLVNYMNYLKEKNLLKADDFYLNTRPQNYRPKSGLIGPVIIKVYE